MKRRKKTTTAIHFTPRPRPVPEPSGPDFTNTPPDRYVIFTRLQVCQCCGTEREHSEFFAERTWINTSTKAQCFHRQNVTRPEFNVPISYRVGGPERTPFCVRCPPERVAATMQKLKPIPNPDPLPLGWITEAQDAQRKEAAREKSAFASLADITSL